MDETRRCMCGVPLAESQLHLCPVCSREYSIRELARAIDAHELAATAVEDAIREFTGGEEADCLHPAWSALGPRFRRALAVEAATTLVVSLESGELEDVKEIIQGVERVLEALEGK